MSESSCVVFGGAGFIGTHLVRRLLASGRFSRVHVADLRPHPREEHPRGISSSITDVRPSHSCGFVPGTPDWIFNLAAIHREPGHSPEEYFDTNLAGARNVCDYAESVGCRNIYFTSSISVYGPTLGPTGRGCTHLPSNSIWGLPKYPAEWIHRCWQAGSGGRRLVICRPAVIYGPGDPGNILRMIQAIRKGYFAFPGSTSIYKAYGYIFGLLDSIDFVMDRVDGVIYYNYAEASYRAARRFSAAYDGFPR